MATIKVFSEIFDQNRLVVQIYDLNSKSEVNFPTPDTAEMQCGFGEVAKDVYIMPHIHNRVERLVVNTSEFILIIKGTMEVEFLSSRGHFIESRTLTSLQGFLQFEGGHKIKIFKGTRYIELKQGPYLGKDRDKTLL